MCHESVAYVFKAVWGALIIVKEVVIGRICACFDTAGRCGYCKVCTAYCDRRYNITSWIFLQTRHKLSYPCLWPVLREWELGKAGQVIYTLQAPPSPHSPSMTAMRTCHQYILILGTPWVHCWVFHDHGLLLRWLQSLIKKACKFLFPSHPNLHSIPRSRTAPLIFLKTHGRNKNDSSWQSVSDRVKVDWSLKNKTASIRKGATWTFRVVELSDNKTWTKGCAYFCDRQVFYIVRGVQNQRHVRCAKRRTQCVCGKMKIFMGLEMSSCLSTERRRSNMWSLCLVIPSTVWEGGRMKAILLIKSLHLPIWTPMQS